MAYTASTKNTSSNKTRLFAYTAYNLGLGIAIGFARIAVAVAYLAKHWFYTQRYNKQGSREEDTEMEGLAPDESSASAFMGKAQALRRRAEGSFRLGNAGVVASNGEGSLISRAARQKECYDGWKAEAYRGIAEVLWVGAPYYTWKEIDNVSYFGLEVLQKRIENEHQLDEMLNFEHANHNPWF